MQAAYNSQKKQLLISTVVIRVDPQYYRPTVVDLLIGDPSKPKKWVQNHNMFWQNWLKRC